MGSAFMAMCLLHSAIATTCGALMMFYGKEMAVVGHGRETASRLAGSTPHDQLLLQTSDAFSGMLLFAIGWLLFMVAFVRDRDFQTFFAGGCSLLNFSMAFWRFYFEGHLEDLARDCPRQAVGDLLLSLSWILFLVYTWREKYD